MAIESSTILVFDIAVVILLATILAYFARILKQPLILAYILAGILAGPTLLSIIEDTASIDFFAKIGIAFLLFIVGINLNFKQIKEVGMISVVTGVGQVLFTSFIGYFIAIYLGFNQLTAIYISVALTFSSTIIIIKLLSDKQDLDSLYGRISIGFLLVQDFIAILALVLLSGLGNTQVSATSLLLINLFKISLLFFVVYLFSRTLLPAIFSRTAKSYELLFISSIAWCFSLAMISALLGFSIEIGAFLAGVALANLPYHYEIASKIKPLRDFFIVLFFISLGAQINITSISNILVPAILFSLFILIGNPIIVMVLLGLFGYKKRTSFLAGLTVAQISEFSLILVALGKDLGHLSSETVVLVTIVGVITIAISTYMITYADKLYNYLSPLLEIFEKKKTVEHKFSTHKHKQYDFILIGVKNTGSVFLEHFKKKKEKVLVVDYNPEVVQKVSKDGVPTLYGDVADLDTLEMIKNFSPKFVIFTLGNIENSSLAIDYFKKNNADLTIIVTARTKDEALDLYEAGADYVILPYLSIAEIMTHVFDDLLKKKSNIVRIRNKHIKHLLNLNLN